MKDIKVFLQENQQEMLEVLAKLVSYNSVEAQDSEFPFGQANADCLDYALEVCRNWGMQTTNHDYYVGFGEIGKGQEVIGIAGHLDIVPAGKGWNTDPFVLEIIDGKLYGRGTSDDKGPTVAAMFAMKYLMDNDVALNKRIRIVFGCNEESGFQCIAKYVEKEGHFDIGFVPDGPFPCCFGEKGIIKFKIKAKNNVFKTLSGGVAPNVVPNNCELSLAADLIDQEKLEDYLKSSALAKYEITENEGILTLVTEGRAAHASTPELGVNAVAYAMTALTESGLDDAALRELKEKINIEYNGNSCGIKLVDQYGGLTLNVGIVELVGDDIVITCDIRCPFTHDNSEVTSVLKQTFQEFELTIMSDSKGLYQPEDSEFVQMLISAYRSVSGNEAPPLTMGGGTYARMVNNTLAFGMSDGEDTHIHDANEYVQLKKLLEGTEVYINALLKMLEM